MEIGGGQVGDDCSLSVGGLCFLALAARAGVVGGHAISVVGLGRLVQLFIPTRHGDGRLPICADFGMSSGRGRVVDVCDGPREGS